MSDGRTLCSLHCVRRADAPGASFADNALFGHNRVPIVSTLSTTRLLFMIIIAIRQVGSLCLCLVCGSAAAAGLTFVLQVLRSRACAPRIALQVLCKDCVEKPRRELESCPPRHHAFHLAENRWPCTIGWVAFVLSEVTLFPHIAQAEIPALSAVAGQRMRWYPTYHSP